MIFKIQIMIDALLIKLLKLAKAGSLDQFFIPLGKFINQNVLSKHYKVFCDFNTVAV